MTRKPTEWLGGRLQQLLREWESNFLAELRSSADYKPARARPKLEDLDPASEKPLAELIFVPCPCDGCEFRRRCATGLACDRFSLFLHGHGKKRWERATCEPTRARFEALSG